MSGFPWKYCFIYVIGEYLCELTTVPALHIGPVACVMMAHLTTSVPELQAVMHDRYRGTEMIVSCVNFNLVY
jgi:hypothetical protein